MRTKNDEPQFTTPQVLEAVGLKKSRLHKYLREGYLTPAEPSPGSGLPNRFSTNDCIRLSILKIFSERRLLGSKDSKVAGYLVGGLRDNFLSKEVLYIGPEAESTAWSTKLDGVPKGADPMIIAINLSLIRRNLRERL